MTLGLTAALERLDEEREALNTLLGVSPRSAGAWKEVLRCCRRALRSEPRNLTALRLEGRALAFLGEGRSALRSLDLALRLEPGNPQAWAWRGEARLLCGLAGPALSDLDRASALDPDGPWPRLARAILLLSQGRGPRAEKDLEHLLARTGPQGPAGLATQAVWALWEGQQGRPLQGIARMDRVFAELSTDGGAYARGSRPRLRALLHGVRGLLRRGARDLPGSLSDWDEALACEPEAWVLSHKADALNRSGFYREALEESRRLARLLPRSPQPHVQAANIYFDQAFYPEALAAIGRAIRRGPADPGLRARRAKFLMVTGNLGRARADLERALRLDPSNSQWRFEKLMTLCLDNRFALVLREIRRRRLPGAYAQYLLGFLRCRQGRYSEARRHFLRAAGSESGDMARRARFYALASRILSEAGKDPRGEPRPRPRRRHSLAITLAQRPTRFFLCGIGIRHPYQISVEGLRALGRCHVLYNNVGDPQVAEFLGLFQGRVQAVTRVQGGTALERARKVLRSLPRRWNAAFVTRIHPTIYRRIANDLVALCREEGVDFRVASGVSLTEVAWSLGDNEVPVGRGRADPVWGLRVFDIAALCRHPGWLEPGFPMVVYCIAGPEERAGLLELLKGRYPAQHRIYLLAGSGEREQEVSGFALSDLKEPLIKADSGAVIYVPAR